MPNISASRATLSGSQAKSDVLLDSWGKYLRKIFNKSKRRPRYQWPVDEDYAVSTMTQSTIPMDLSRASGYSMRQAPRLPATMFGGYLEDSVDETSGVAKFVLWCVTAIETTEENLRTDAIYRASGNQAKIQDIVAQHEAGMVKRLESEDNVNVLTGALKLFFRQLKEPLLDYSISDRLLTSDSPQDEFRLHVNSLPVVKRMTLAFMMSHLQDVLDHRDTNKMSTSGLGIIFGPTLMRLSTNPRDMAFDMKQQNKIIEFMLEHHDTIFQDQYHTEPDQAGEPVPVSVHRDQDNDSCSSKSSDGDRAVFEDTPIGSVGGRLGHATESDHARTTTSKVGSIVVKNLEKPAPVTVTKHVAVPVTPTKRTVVPGAGVGRPVSSSSTHQSSVVNRPGRISYNEESSSDDESDSDQGNKKNGIQRKLAVHKPKGISEESSSSEESDDQVKPGRYNEQKPVALNKSAEMLSGNAKTPSAPVREQKSFFSAGLSAFVEDPSKKSAPVTKAAVNQGAKGTPVVYATVEPKSNRQATVATANGQGAQRAPPPLPSTAPPYRQSVSVDKGQGSTKVVTMSSASGIPVRQGHDNKMPHGQGSVKVTPLVSTPSHGLGVNTAKGQGTAKVTPILATPTPQASSKVPPPPPASAIPIRQSTIGQGTSRVPPPPPTSKPPLASFPNDLDSNDSFLRNLPPLPTSPPPTETDQGKRYSKVPPPIPSALPPNFSLEPVYYTVDTYDNRKVQHSLSQENLLSGSNTSELAQSYHDDHHLIYKNVGHQSTEFRTTSSSVTTSERVVVGSTSRQVTTGSSSRLRTSNNSSSTSDEDAGDDLERVLDRHIQMIRHVPTAL